MDNNKAIMWLRQALLKKINVSELQADSCKLISINLFTESGAYVSISTLRRVFGAGAGQPVLSVPPAIFDILSRYAGFESWAALRALAAEDSGTALSAQDLAYPL
ncbi:hypothetical protein [Pedobacter sp. GSP4]|uniref:hypothetical protein n=1 Tax=Pedobacter sp. GSP4 TaxID=3453716 RepID=UPI003F6F6108